MNVCPTCHQPIVSSLPTLTKHQHGMLSYLDQYVCENGYAPSYEEIAAHFKYRSLATVHEHLGNLAAKGYIRREYNETRAITILRRP